MRFGIDLDGTVFEYMKEPFSYSPTEMRAIPFPGCVEILKGVLAQGHEVHIYTCRMNPTMESNKPYSVEQLRAFVVYHLDKHGIPYTSISEYKPVCDYYLDDRNIAFSTWADFEKLLQEMEVI